MVKIKQTSFILMILLLMASSFASTHDVEISEEDKSTFDSILEPIAKIYNFVKYAATSIAVLYLVFVGLTFITAGNDQHKRDNAKTQAAYVVVGLVIIWVAPIVVQYLTS